MRVLVDLESKSCVDCAHWAFYNEKPYCKLVMDWGSKCNPKKWIITQGGNK